MPGTNRSEEINKMQQTPLNQIHKGLFSPIQIKTLCLSNRIVMPPMGVGMATPTGGVADGHIQHYVARARAHPGLIIVEFTWVAPDGRPHTPGVLGIDSDNQIPGLRRLASAIKETGTPVAIQLAHAGARARSAIIGCQPAGPSDVLAPGESEKPRTLRVEEIAVLVRRFGDAALRAAEAGFDAVELHGAHGFLLSQFVSPYTNQRQDAYGRTVEGRLRFPLEVVAELRQRLGHHFPLAYRLGAADLMPEGLTLEEGTVVAARLADAGVDLLDISAGLSGAGEKTTRQGYFVYLAEAVKKAVNVPVIGVGNITEPEYADCIIREGRVDLVAVGRAMLANPNWAAEAARQLQGR